MGEKDFLIQKKVNLVRGLHKMKNIVMIDVRSKISISQKQFSILNPFYIKKKLFSSK